MVIRIRRGGGNDGYENTPEYREWVSWILGKFPNLTPTSDPQQYSFACSGHDDRKNSGSVRIEDGKVIFQCFAGCEYEHIRDALGLKNADLNFNLEISGSPKLKLKKTRRPKSASQTKTDDPSPSSPGPSRLGKEVDRYDYCDEDGAVLFQVRRYESKDFLQYRPNGRGGWKPGIKNVRRVLYCLPELIAADPTEIVFIVEGEKDVDRLRAEGFIATCNPGGAEKWQEDYNESLRGRTVVIAPDNDDTGWKHATQVATSLMGIAKSVKIVQLDGLPPKGDVSDWLDAGHTGEELLQRVGSADEWTPEAEELEFRPFPTECLPNPLRSFVREASKALGCDESYIAVPLLSVLAAAIGNSRRIRLKKGWCEPAVIWAAIVGDSGTLKSPALELLLAYLHRLQQLAVEAYEERLKKYESALPEYEKKYAKGKSETPATARAPQALIDTFRPQPPVLERFLCSDTTIEALSLLLENQPRGLLMFRDELSGWMASFDAYRPSSGADEAHWLSMHRAGPLTVDRKTDRRLISVPHAAVSVTGGIQPLVLARVLEPRHFDSGLASRLLFAFPPKPLRKWTDDEISDECRKSYESIIDALYGLEFDLEDGVRDVPRDLPLSDSGREEWIAFFDEHAQEQFMIGGDASAAWSKLEGYAARIALVIHCVRAVSDDPSLESTGMVDAESINAGVTMARWFGREALRVYFIVRPAKAVEHASRVQELLAVMRRNGGRITVRQLTRSSRRFGNTEEAEQWLKILVDLGLARCAVVQTKGRPRVDYVLIDPGVVKSHKT